jgi:uncharacterized protein YlxW (UPF0749 family)
MIKKILKYVWSFLAGMFVLMFFFYRTKKSPTPTSPHKRAINDLETELDSIEEKKKKLVEEGVDDLTLEEELEYWNNN